MLPEKINTGLYSTLFSREINFVVKIKCLKCNIFIANSCNFRNKMWALGTMENQIC